ncbi:MAG: hypothetical protein AAFN11_15380 [Chloroflexota bacterium]
MVNRKNQLKLANHQQQTARMLIDQQMWCWGCDVRRADGNLLLGYGGKKRPSPNPRYKSAYVFQLQDEMTLNLWSWGLWIACPQHGSLFLGRSRFRLCYIRETISIPNAWSKRDLALTEMPLTDDDRLHAHHLLTVALRWIGDYEAWVGAEVDLAYRENALTKWPQRKRNKGGIPASEMADSWYDLSTSIIN